jgi:hypothetical protein
MIIATVGAAAVVETRAQVTLRVAQSRLYSVNTDAKSMGYVDVVKAIQPELDRMSLAFRKSSDGVVQLLPPQRLRLS